MKVFEYLSKVREIERSCFPYTQSLAERDICLAIGLYNERGASVTLKDLKSFSIASHATIERALGRLIAEGAVRQIVSRRDGRRRELKLDTAAARRLGRYHVALQRSFLEYVDESD
jgi:DNA-binding MarR family transcriptional regulator